MDIQQDMDDIKSHNNSEEKYIIRKSKKPLMEKRRRQRINNCLQQLKSLVLQAMKKDTSHYSKLEKADILEMTVKHLRMLQRRQISSAVAADPTVAAKYNIGFAECASEVTRYLSTVQGVNEEVRSRVVGHLEGCMHSMTASTIPHHNVQPIHVQIPTTGHERTQNHVFSSERLLLPGTPRQSTMLQTQMQQTGNLPNAFELLPGNNVNGHVALYLGHSNEMSNVYSTPVAQSQVHVSLTTPNVDSQKISVNKLNYCSPDFQSPIGHYGHQSEQKVTGQPSSPAFSPVLCALKEERLWRPW